MSKTLPSGPNVLATALATALATSCPGALTHLDTPRAEAAGKPASKVVLTTLDEWRKSFAALRAKPGTRAVLVNVWATWCEPCKEEMPDLVRFARDNKAKGVHVMLVSADSRSEQAAVASYLGSLGVDFTTYLKTGDDMAFINGIDPDWDGTIPASWLFEPSGKRAHLFRGKVTFDELTRRLDSLIPQHQTEPHPARRKP
jgi:thiol-disulfide isomerase/thioredoxin